MIKQKRYKLLLIDEGCYVCETDRSITPLLFYQEDIDRYFTYDANNSMSERYHVIINGNTYFCIKDRASFEIQEAEVSDE